MRYLPQFETIRRAILIISVAVLSLSLLCMIILSFLTRTAMTIVLSDMLFALLLFSISLLIMWMVTKSTPFQTKQNKFFKGVFVVIAIITVIGFAIPKSFTSVADLSAVLSDNFYYVEGEVISTFITSSSTTSISSRTARTSHSDHYTQRLFIGDKSNGLFKYYVSGIEDYHLLEGEHYKIKALPSSKLILEYEHIKR